MGNDQQFTVTQQSTIRPTPPTGATADDLLALFNISRDEEVIMKIDYLAARFKELHDSIKQEQAKMTTDAEKIAVAFKRIKELEKIRSVAVKNRVSATDELNRRFAGETILEIDKEVERLKRNIRFLREPKDKNKERPTIDQIKAIKISTILSIYNIKIERGNFFKLRNERTPSCKFNEEKNVYYDFGAARGGSVIDLYMVIHSCSLKEALKNLSDMVNK